ncbi:MAG: peptidylprolyl isomerase [Terriglobales bacterium]
MQYARLLTAAIEAEKQNLEKNPETQELVRFSRMQALAQELSRKLLQDAQPGAEQTQKYYQDNASQFEEITLRRILLPASSKNVTKDEMKQFAEQLQKRAAAGEDFDKLQKEGYEKAGMQNPPSTTVVLRVQNLTPEEEAAAKLKPGEVSQVISQPTTSLIYKLAQRKPIPFDKVKPEIEATLRQQNYQAEVEKLLNSSPPTLSDAYFGAEPGQAVEGPNQDTNGKQEHEPGAPQRKPSEAPRK